MSTSRRVVFLIERKNYYRVLGPVVDAALLRGWTVECWHDWAQPRWGTKASEFPDWTPAFRHGAPAVSSYQGQTDLCARLAASPPDAVLALGPPPPGLHPRPRWIGFQYMTNLVNPFGPEGFRACDHIAGYSAFWLEQALDYLGAAGALVDADAARDMAAKFVPVGIPEMDQVEAIDPQEVRHRLGLPADRPVVVYLPYPVKSNPPTFWLRHVYGPRNRLRRAVAVAAARRHRYWPHVAKDWTDSRLVETVRQFCDANGAVLVVKSRQKDPVPRHTVRRADRVFYDPSHYPATILELLSVASLCVHFFSSAAYEAVFMGVPSLCLAPEADDMGISPLWTRQLFHVREGGSYNVPGASYSLSLADVYEHLATRSFKDFPLDPLARARFVETFMGFDDTKSSDRALDLVEAEGAVMTERRIPVAEPALGQEEMDNVMAAMKSGWISSLGAFIPEFERDFAAFSGAAHGVAVANGTVALHLALVAAGIGPGDEVLMPSLTFVATASAVRYCGAVPVFVDSDPATWQLDPAALEAKVTPRAKAIVVVHLYGHPCEMDPIRAVAARHGLTVIEDAAEAHGARYRGRPVGALGAIGCFSFYGNKIITTGEGGMCLTDDPAMAEHLRLLRDHGMDPKRPYWHDIVGYNYRMTNLQAAVGVAQVKKIAMFIDKKREMAAWYAESLGPLAAAGRIRLQPEAPWARSVFWMNSVILADTPVSVEQVRARMSDRGVDSRPFFHPAHLLPPYATGERLPVAEYLSSRGLNLPSGTSLTRDEVNRAARALADALEATR